MSYKDSGLASPLPIWTHHCTQIQLLQLGRSVIILRYGILELAVIYTTTSPYVRTIIKLTFPTELHFQAIKGDKQFSHGGGVGGGIIQLVQQIGILHALNT